MIKHFAAALLLVPTTAMVGMAMPLAAQAADVAQASVAERIAGLLVPTSLVTDRSVAAFAQNFRASSLANPQAAALEKQYPGTLDAGQKAGEAALATVMRQAAPSLQAQLATLIGDNFDGVEQQGLLDFLRSSAGQHMVAMGDQMYDQTKIRAALVKSGGKVTQADLANALNPDFVNHIAPADLQAITAFSMSPAGLKLSSVTPQMQQIVAAWSTSTIAQSQTQIQQAIKGAVGSHIAAAKASQGSPAQPAAKANGS